VKTRSGILGKRVGKDRDESENSSCLLTRGTLGGGRGRIVKGEWSSAEAGGFWKSTDRKMRKEKKKLHTPGEERVRTKWSIVGCLRGHLQKNKKRFEKRIHKSQTKGKGITSKKRSRH